MTDRNVARERTEARTQDALAGGDPEMERIVDEEERVLLRVQRTLSTRAASKRHAGVDYDAELVSLRDQIKEARLEDVPPLVEEMERMQQVAARRAQVTEVLVDSGSPYFGRLVLEENGRKREVLIGRATFLDSTTGIRIVDWRDAPVSRIYYRYEEGDDYEEEFGGRPVDGDVLIRRSLSIQDGELRRIGCPQGTFIKGRDGVWRRAGEHAMRLHGGQGTALRPESHHRPGKLGVGEGDGREDKVLSEITALIDPLQFELITKPTSGLVVIQGGAGSGKTTIGLHRLAYLSFQEPQRFRPDRMLVVVFNDALVRYIGRVLPALGVHGVQVMTYERWTQRLRLTHLQDLPTDYAEDTPGVVLRLKKHPAMLALMDDHVQRTSERVDTEVVDTGKRLEGGGKALRVWRDTAGQAPGRRVQALLGWLRKGEGEAAGLPLETRHGLERVLTRLRDEARDVVGTWAELLTDRSLLERFFGAQSTAAGAFTERELDWVHSWCSRRCGEVASFAEEQAERRRDGAGGERGSRESFAPQTGIDGQEEREVVALDREDDTLLLRLCQSLRGPLTRKRDDLRYEHIFVDEAQDLSPVELAVVLDTASPAQSITLAGDVAQRLMMDNGFTDWSSVIDELGFDAEVVEPLRLSYRSTHEILEFAANVLGPLREQASGFEATRHGAPVEQFSFGGAGEAVGFLSEALRDLAQAEPLASVAVIARYPEQADLYHKGLVHGEVPNLRRIADQDFPFRPGVDVTDARQVKGLEFDYVVLVEVNAASYPPDDEARHLLHIGATRAAHQLWVLSTGKPSRIVDEA
jgi:DNA helicase II / ATP-dependent DNA helicase PcrA